MSNVIKFTKEMDKESKNEEVRQCRDFSYVETLESLKDIPGWYRFLNDKRVRQIFKSILARGLDGHYLIWFWEKMKRPAICVSHNNAIETFVIHRRPSTLPDYMYDYYIEKSQRKQSLKETVLYHIKNGISKDDTTVVLLKTPIVSCFYLC